MTDINQIAKTNGEETNAKYVALIHKHPTYFSFPPIQPVCFVVTRFVEFANAKAFSPRVLIQRISGKLPTSSRHSLPNPSSTT